MSHALPKQQHQCIDLARYIARHADQSLSLKHLAERAQMSSSQLQRAFKSVLGVSPKKFQQAARSAHFKSLLRAGKDVTTAIFEAGYGSTSRLYEQQHLGMACKSYRRGGEGEAISYACITSVYGPLLLAATDRGVCFVQFGEDEAALLAELQREFPNARLSASDAGHTDHDLRRWAGALNRYLLRQGPRPDLPLDLRGTALQTEVWQFLMRTREGEQMSYGALARAIGRPQAVRAVASACGRNRIAVLIPCHRILRADGGLGGYRWGLERKRALLSVERGDSLPLAE